MVHSPSHEFCLVLLVSLLCVILYRVIGVSCIKFQQKRFPQCWLGVLCESSFHCFVFCVLGLFVNTLAFLLKSKKLSLKALPNEPYIS
jgi:hypothetical protein